ncbi:MAG: hypothetical protein P8P40_13640 [Sulfitobacter sp.]|jgi:hypothetical protein|nr:hypothetical protein [Sulfitobacter sp.]MDG1354001.1 hypothetical protein [Sulfitobacter sp.]
MPQADLSYSADLKLDAAAILAAVEETIAARDNTSGACKGRAYPLEQTHHTHVLLRLRMLRKPHRDDAFMQGLLAALQTALEPLIPTPCILGVELGFLEPHYASRTLV